MKRRLFLKAVGGATGGLALGMEAALGAEPARPAGDAEAVAGLPRRVLGRTGQKISVVGFPGLALARNDQKRGTEVLHAAMDRGVNYFDVAPAYGDAQEKMGIALEGIDRTRYFLACKTNQRDKEGARKDLERSLVLLKTDHFDLYQLHHLRRLDEVKQALGPSGAMETLLKAKEEGKVRWLGFSAHTTLGAIEALKGFRFDTVMFPITFAEYFLWGFGKEVLDLAAKEGAAVLAMKAMCRGAWPKDTKQPAGKWWYPAVEEPEELELAWRFVLSQTPVVAGIPPAVPGLLDKAIDAAKKYRPITQPELDKLRRIAKTCESLFQKEAVAGRGTGRHAGPMLAGCPQACYGIS